MHSAAWNRVSDLNLLVFLVLWLKFELRSEPIWLN
jgi:hypothetical protein